VNREAIILKFAELAMKLARTPLPLDWQSRSDRWREATDNLLWTLGLERGSDEATRVGAALLAFGHSLVREFVDGENDVFAIAALAVALDPLHEPVDLSELPNLDDEGGP
jgi:hypothetical protein